MAEKILMTALSPTMENGVLGKWLKKEGDKIEEGDVICQVETDKASVDYEATFSGTLLKIVLKEGSSAKVGETIGIFGKPGEDFSSLLSSASGSTAAQLAKKVEEGKNKLHEVSTGIYENLKNAGQKIIENAKKALQDSTNVSFDKRLRISPLAKNLALEKGLDLQSLIGKGSGPGGRVIKADIENAKPISKPQGIITSAISSVIKKLEDKEIPVSGKRKVIAQRLSESMFTAPHYYLFNSVNMEKIISSRESLNAELKDKKISFNAFFMKFAAEAIKKHPEINSSFQGDKIVQFASIDIGLAVDINGLITPVVRNVDSKGIIEIEDELKFLIDKVKKGTLQPNEYSGATFSITNLGSFGIDMFTAIINPPGSSILAIGNTVKKPVVDELGNIVVKPIATLSLSSDHRSIDGKLAGIFFKELCNMIENPIRVLF